MHVNCLMSVRYHKKNGLNVGISTVNKLLGYRVSLRTIKCRLFCENITLLDPSQVFVVHCDMRFTCVLYNGMQKLSVESVF